MLAQQFAIILAQNDGAAEAIGGLVCMLVMFVFGIAAFAIWLWALIDAIRNPSLDGNMKLIWVLVIVITGILGAILYLILGRGKRTGG